MVLPAEKNNIGPASQRIEIRTGRQLTWPHQHQRTVRVTLSDAAEQSDVNVIRQPADVSEDWARHAGNVRRNRQLFGERSAEQLEIDRIGNKVCSWIGDPAPVLLSARGRKHDVGAPGELVVETPE